MSFWAPLPRGDGRVIPVIRLESPPRNRSISGACGGGTEHPKNLVARRASKTSCFMDFCGGHRLSQSFSTHGLKSSQDSCEQRIVEVSEWIEEEQMEEGDTDEARDRIEVVPRLGASSNAYSDICIVIVDEFLRYCRL